MLYVKKNLCGCEIHINIQCDNVYAKCPRCGAEVSVDMNTLIEDMADWAVSDIENAEVFCDKCSALITQEE